MKKVLGSYLIVLGVFEVVLCGLWWFDNSFNRFLLAPPHFSLLWMVPPPLAISLMVIAVALRVGTGVALLTNRRRFLVLYCVAGGLFALAALPLPLMVLIAGGGHMFSADDALIMLLNALLYDLIPVSLSIWLVIRSREARWAST